MIRESLFFYVICLQACVAIMLVEVEFWYDFVLELDSIIQIVYLVIEFKAVQLCRDVLIREFLQVCVLGLAGMLFEFFYGFWTHFYL